MFDFKALTADGTLYNFHSHTQFCDGRAGMKDFAEAAVRAGFTHYGFTPHSPVPIESDCNMAEADVLPYMMEVERLRTLFPATRFYCGMEVDYLGSQWGPAHPYFAAQGLDYMIGSVHFIPTQEGRYVDIDGSPGRFRKNLDSCFHGDLEYVVRTFYAQSVDMVRAGCFDMIGHFDKVGMNASTIDVDIELKPWYTTLVEDLIEEISKSGVTVEINTKAYDRHGRIFPSERYLPLLRELDVPVVVNSDAHYPDLINAGRAYGLSLL